MPYRTKGVHVAIYTYLHMSFSMVLNKIVLISPLSLRFHVISTSSAHTGPSSRAQVLS
jgi:hypothetical protein